MKIESGVETVKSGSQDPSGLAFPQMLKKTRRVAVKLSDFGAQPKVVLGISALIGAHATAVKVAAENIRSDGFEIVITVTQSGALVDEIGVSWLAYG